MSRSVSSFWRKLLDWYREHGRDFPWRRTQDPFLVLMAEMLLQQTHVRKVQPVYEALAALYPTAADMACADSRHLEALIQPLGLAYRAQRLKRCAQAICSDFDGWVPADYRELTRLPGVGPYIADAVLCYAFGQATVPIDTNVLRLFTRYFGLTSQRSRPRTDPVLAEAVRNLFPRGETRQANLAVLDFAAAICTARRPACGTCPAARSCRAARAGCG